mmetsp:Transcript_18229/g.36783  ORF Transcript_18229/g.36783 Transcript_18229/m.36783 type:complete len:331 (+) Transcript_18229:292-1284(+)
MHTTYIVSSESKQLLSGPRTPAPEPGDSTGFGRESFSELRTPFSEPRASRNPKPLGGRAQHHFIQGLASGNHGVDVFLLVNEHFHHHRSVVVFQELLHLLRQLLLCAAPQTLDVESFRHLHKVGIRHPRGRIPLVVEKVLPLLDHALEIVVQHQSLHSDVEFRSSHQLHASHAVGSISVNIDNDFLWSRQLRSDGSREAVTHSSQASTGDHRAWKSPSVVLSSPHLMLSDSGCDEHVVLDVSRLSVELLNHLLRLALGSGAFVLVVGERVLFLPLIDHSEPLLAVRELDVRQDFVQNLTTVSFESQVNLYGLVDVLVEKLNVDDAPFSSS